MVSKETELLKFTSNPFLALETLPDLVVIMITPFEALDPYNALADEPFRTFILAISFWSRSEIPLPYAPPPVVWSLVVTWLLLYGTPSTIIKGWLSPKNDELPLI